jgi:hypothetical protein
MRDLEPDRFTDVHCSSTAQGDVTMRKTIFAIATAATLIGAPVAAYAQTAAENNAAGGAVTGGLTGAGVGFLVGGPIGAAVGAGIGTTAGATMGATATPERRVYVQQQPTTYVERHVYQQQQQCFQDEYGQVFCQ